MGSWRLLSQGIWRKPLWKQWKIFGFRGEVESNFIIICLFEFILVLMELVRKLRFLNEYGKLETVKPGDWEEASEGATVGASDAWVVYTVSFLAILLMVTV